MTPRVPLRSARSRFSAASVAVGLAVPLLTLALVGPVPSALFLATLCYAIGALLALALMRRGYPHDSPGLCNIVTLIRLGLTASLLAPLLAPSAAWAVISLAVMVLILDGADGWLARREGRVSGFGARFDMEVDAALGLILALNAWGSGAVGPVVLLLGLPRYLFAAAGRVWPWMAAPLPERAGRKAVCVAQIATLIALQAPFVEGELALGLVLAAAGALLWSFGRDTLWLWRARP